MLRAVVVTWALMLAAAGMALWIGCATDHHSMIVPVQRAEDAANLQRQWQTQQIQNQQQTQQQNEQWSHDHSHMH